MRHLRRLRNNLSLPIGHALIGERKDDQYLASYPRSGSTWLRTMLVNIMVPGANSNPDVFNRVIPGVSITQIPVIRRLESPRLIHSHTCYRPSIKRCVYTVRDGRDVLVSFYHYLTTRENCEVGFEEWYYRYEAGEFGPGWEKNVTSWLIQGKQRLGGNLLINRFEEMKSKPMESIHRICTYLDIPASIEDVRRAVEQASLGNVRKIEQERANPPLSGDASFYRGGKSGQWKDYFTPALMDRFTERAGECMKLAGYFDE